MTCCKFGFVSTWTCHSESLQNVSRFAVAKDELRTSAMAEGRCWFLYSGRGHRRNERVFLFSFSHCLCLMIITWISWNSWRNFRLAFGVVRLMLYVLSLTVTYFSILCNKFPSLYIYIYIYIYIHTKFSWKFLYCY